MRTGLVPHAQHRLLKWQQRSDFQALAAKLITRVQEEAQTTAIVPARLDSALKKLSRVAQKMAPAIQASAAFYLLQHQHQARHLALTEAQMVTLLLRHVFAPGPLPVHTQLLHYLGFQGIFFAGRTYGHAADAEKLREEHRRLPRYIVPDLDQSIAYELVDQVKNPKPTCSQAAAPPQLYIYAVAGSAAGLLLHNSFAAKTAFVAYSEDWHTWTVPKTAVILDPQKLRHIIAPVMQKMR